VEKMLELGLVNDKRQLWKKRQKKGGPIDGTKNDRRRRKNGSSFTELADLVSDEHSSSESTYLSSQLIY